MERATIADLDAVIAFYDDVIDRTPGIAGYARWAKGIHPTAEGLKALIEEGSLYLIREDDKIVGAVAVTMYQGEDYHSVKWARDLADNEVAAIHILGVSPDCQGRGMGAAIVGKAIDLARANCKKALRLDATASNTPVHRLYERLGFEYRGGQRLYAENNGWLDFVFYEYGL